MKCFVHLDMELMSKEFPTPEAAIDFVEKNMKDPTLAIKWRRDDNYPDNFSDYTKKDLVEEINKKGEITLQLIGVTKEDIIMGDIATIVTEETEKQDVAEAKAELDKLGKELAAGYQTEISIRAHGETKSFKPPKKTRSRKRK